MTSIEWSDGAPIYRQLKERVVAMLLDGLLKPGDALPSVRQVAAEYAQVAVTGLKAGIVPTKYVRLSEASLCHDVPGLFAMLYGGRGPALFAGLLSIIAGYSFAGARH